MTQAAPWWGVPVIAGAFLILGGLLTFLYALIQSRQQAARDTAAHFRGEVLDQFDKIDRALDDLHNGVPANGDGVTQSDDQFDVWVGHSLAIQSAARRLRLIAPRQVYDVAERIDETLNRMNPRGRDEFVMPELHELNEELIAVLRDHLGTSV